MDKVCEYCKVLRPVVYCKADSANLCLQCDAKIHSANALSNRHSRTLVCESCRCHWAYIRCSNHQMFMCRSCDRSQHNVSSQHQRRVISGYIGCPSSKDLAALWGFNLNALDDSTWQNQVRGSLIASKVDSATSDSGAECEVGRSGKHSKAFYEGKQQEGTCFILQQILNLKRIQSIDGSNSSSFIRRQEQIDISSTENDSIRKLENNLDQHLQHSLGLVTDFQNMGSPNQDLDIDAFPSPFSHLDHLSSSSPGGSPLQEESIWQCKIPDQNGQLWSQNMQDLGVCEELGYLDEPSMPDIDLTFRNYEELFRGDEPEPKRTLLNDIANACDSVEKDIFFDTSEYGYAREMQETALPEAKEIIRPSYKEKKKKVRRNDTQVQYATRKARDEWKQV